MKSQVPVCMLSERCMYVSLIPRMLFWSYYQRKCPSVDLGILNYDNTTYIIVVGYYNNHSIRLYRISQCLLACLIVFSLNRIRIEFESNSNRDRCSRVYACVTRQSEVKEGDFHRIDVLRPVRSIIE
jgi:hypothetical protein